ncbi:MAG: HypC/HybG/HupF family hydrogenase formation chaperone [Gammaproteobacteria bacterium]|nr:HypC/HybG/HupF family hydrogenase formation chaperone [Gammaproteobacteria bacterium]MCF6361921.1 HypC/HybG/HupF family hydrogenase formation chaperone [Gammaproteobacteria bacterium]
MCMAIPMQVIEVGEGYAWCESAGERRRIDTLLVGEQPVGTWLLTFLDGAREVLSADEARRISDAVQAVRLVMQGNHDIDHLFADLLDHEPKVPGDTTSSNDNSPA